MKALVIDGVAVNVCANAKLADSFHPDVANLFEDVPANVKIGWVRDEAGNWSSPSDSDGPSSLPTPE